MTARSILRALTRLRPPVVRECQMCARRVRRLTPAHHADIGARRMPECRRWGCTGPLWHPEDLAGHRRHVAAHTAAEYARKWEEPFNG
jgi:hypothetical protein